MWTPAARAQLARDDLPYVSSLSDVEWAVVVPFMPAPAKVGGWVAHAASVRRRAVRAADWASSCRPGRCTAGSCACAVRARSRA